MIRAAIFGIQSDLELHYLVLGWLLLGQIALLEGDGRREGSNVRLNPLGGFGSLLEGLALGVRHLVDNLRLESNKFKFPLGK